ncbi:MAG: hypothetical protein KKA84_04690 [Bacteroidetes bacterium]|nr:hypothetical protein [Bacteroidota bacterium]
MKNKILTRILNKSGLSETFDKLTNNLSGTDLQSLLMNVFQRRVQNLTPREVLNNFKSNRFVKKAPLPQKVILDFDRLLISLLPDNFESIEISPITPLGSTSVFARVNQNNSVSTVRNTEVVSDATNVLAMECALRREEFLAANPKDASSVNLATSHRVVRAQKFEGPVSFAHFRLFALTSAGRDSGSLVFEMESLWSHISYYLNLFAKLKIKGYPFGKVSCKLTFIDGAAKETIEKSIASKIREFFPEVLLELCNNKEVTFEYYKTIRFQISTADASEKNLLIVDGGFTDWNEKLLSNKKERLLISGMGSERFLFCFAPKDS